MTDTPEIPATPENVTPPTPPMPPVPRSLTEAPASSQIQASTPQAPQYQAPQYQAPQYAQPHIAAHPYQQEQQAPKPAKPAKTGASFVRVRPVVLVAAIAVAALIGGGTGAGVMLLGGSGNSSSHAATVTTPANITVNDPGNATTVTAVAAKAAASVVTISATSSDAGGTGSGVVLTDDGYVLTNTHVVTLDGATGDATIKVQTNDGRLFTAKVIGTDPISDLAVIKLDGVKDLQPATFADSSKLNVGDAAVAIGAPLGLSGTVTDGIVSAINRSITIASSAAPEADAATPDTTTPDTSSPFDFWQNETPGQTAAPTTTASTISLAVIQTDAAINPGNSGGALLNSDGEVIGINVAIASAGGTSAASQSGSIGVGFAIPSNLAKRVSGEIIKTGTATHGLLGASVADVTDETTTATNATVGATIKEISAGGAAASAGLKAGDVITGIGELPVTGKTDLTAQVRALAAGATVKVSYTRDGKADTVDVTLGKL